MQIYHLPSKNQNALERQLVCLTFAHVRCILRQTPLSNPGSATFQHAGGIFCARPISRPVKSRTRILRRPGGPTYPPSRGTKGGVAPGGSAKRGGLTQGSARKKVTDASLLEAFGRLIPLPGGQKGVSPLGAARSAGDRHRYLHEKRSPTRVDDLFSWR